MRGYAFHPKAVDDLDEIWDFIASDSLEAAQRVIGEILDALETLPISPHMGFRRPELSSAPVRFIVVREFLIVYAPDEEPLWVLAILHGRRNPRVLAALLRDRE